MLLQMDDKACTVQSSNSGKFNTQSMPFQRCLSSPSAHVSMLLSDADVLWPGGHAALPWTCICPGSQRCQGKPL